MFSIEFDIHANQRKKHNISGCPKNKGPENLTFLRLKRSQVLPFKGDTPSVGKKWPPFCRYIFLKGI